MTTLLLFPGAGSGSDHPALLAIERDVAPMSCVRTDFAYRLKGGRRPPDRAPVLLQTIRDAVASCGDGGVILGGRSMGGRMCSMVVADEVDPLPALGLVLISYPLHPPKQPDRLRVEHFGRVHAPCLFVHGTRDPFGAPDELTAHTAAIGGPVTHRWIEGGRHDLAGVDDVVAGLVADWIRATMPPIR